VLRFGDGGATRPPTSVAEALADEELAKTGAQVVEHALTWWRSSGSERAEVSERYSASHGGPEEVGEAWRVRRR
jgi:hypothetical protein